MSVSISTASEAAEHAVLDLAEQLGIPAGNIIVAESGETIWPDTSLGMPEPGKMYAQMLMEGFRVVLEAAGKRYEYHFGDGMVRKRPL